MVGLRTEIDIAICLAIVPLVAAKARVAHHRHGYIFWLSRDNLLEISFLCTNVILRYLQAAKAWLNGMVTLGLRYRHSP